MPEWPSFSLWMSNIPLATCWSAGTPCLRWITNPWRRHWRRRVGEQAWEVTRAWVAVLFLIGETKQQQKIWLVNINFLLHLPFLKGSAVVQWLPQLIKITGKIQYLVWIENKQSWVLDTCFQLPGADELTALKYKKRSSSNLTCRWLFLWRAVDGCWIPSFAGWGKVVDGMYWGFSILARLQVHVEMLQKTVFIT